MMKYLDPDFDKRPGVIAGCGCSCCCCCIHTLVAGGYFINGIRRARKLGDLLSKPRLAFWVAPIVAFFGVLFMWMSSNPSYMRDFLVVTWVVPLMLGPVIFPIIPLVGWIGARLALKGMSSSLDPAEYLLQKDLLWEKASEIFVSTVKGLLVSIIICVILWGVFVR